MPETADTPGAERPTTGLWQSRPRRPRRRPLIVRYWWILPIGAFLGLMAAIWSWMSHVHPGRDPLPGYLSDTGKLVDESLLFTGRKPTRDAMGEFERATRLMQEGSYSSAAAALDATARQLPVPAVFTNLGIVYMRLKDGTHAVRAFRDALSRDHQYQPVRAFLKGTNMDESVEPGDAELEPNDTEAQANAVWLDRPVAGVIAPAVGDQDCYWFTTPKLPRDRLSIAIDNRSATLIPRLRIYDEHAALVAGYRTAAGPGAALRFDYSPAPNTLYYVHVDGAHGSSGAYTLTVNALHAFDAYEPNDTIQTATRITPGQTIDANIMDRDDTDFFGFQTPVPASLQIDLVSHDERLELGLATFDADLRPTGFAPEPKGLGGAVHCEMPMEANRLYYVQVFSKNDTTGGYSLAVK